MDGWMGGWVDGWMEAKAGLRIAYSNQKCRLVNVVINLRQKISFCRIVKKIK